MSSRTSCNSLSGPGQEMIAAEQCLGKRLLQDDSGASLPSKRPALVESSASVITIDDDCSTGTPPALSEPIDLLSKLSQWKRELDTLRMENAARKARIADLERQLSDVGQTEGNYEGSRRRAAKVEAVENEMVHLDKSGFPKIALYPDHADNLLDDSTLERVVNTLALFAKRSVLLFGGHHDALEDKLVVWGYEWPEETGLVPMKFIPSVPGSDSWSDNCRTLRCSVTDSICPVDAEFTCPDPNEVFRVYYKDPVLAGDDSMQRLYTYMVSVVMKTEKCSLPMTVYTFATVAMILARDKAHFSAFVSRASKCKNCADLLMHLNRRFWAEDPGHGDVVHWTTQRKHAQIKKEVFGAVKLEFPIPVNSGLETAPEADASDGAIMPAQCTETAPASTPPPPPPVPQQHEGPLPNDRPQPEVAGCAGDDRFDETGRYRMDRFEKQGPRVRHQDENAASTKDPGKIWTIEIPSGYTTPDLGMNRVLDALADRIPRHMKYEAFVLMFRDVSQQFSSKRFLSSLVSKYDAAMLLECFKSSYNQSEESFASFLYCKIVISRT